MSPQFTEEGGTLRLNFEPLFPNEMQTSGHICGVVALKTLPSVHLFQLNFFLPVNFLYA